MRVRVIHPTPLSPNKSIINRFNNYVTVCGFSIHRHCKKTALFTSHCEAGVGLSTISGRKNVDSGRAQGGSSAEHSMNGNSKGVVPGNIERRMKNRERSIMTVKGEGIDSTFNEEELGKIFDQFDEIDSKQLGVIDQKELG